MWWWQGVRHHVRAKLWRYALKRGERRSHEPVADSALRHLAGGQDAVERHERRRELGRVRSRRVLGQANNAGEQGYVQNRGVSRVALHRFVMLLTTRTPGSWPGARRVGCVAPPAEAATSMGCKGSPPGGGRGSFVDFVLRGESVSVMLGLPG